MPKERKVRQGTRRTENSKSEIRKGSHIKKLEDLDRELEPKKKGVDEP
jgi:hypothetical protein